MTLEVFLFYILGILGLVNLIVIIAIIKKISSRSSYSPSYNSSYSGPSSMGRVYTPVAAGPLVSSLSQRQEEDLYY